MTDEELIVRVVDARDEAAYEELHRRHAGESWYTIWRVIARKRTANEDVDDVNQEVWVKVWKADEAPPGRFMPWLITIAKHKAIDYLRRNESSASLPLEEWDAPVPADEEDLARDFARVLEKLSIEDRRLLKLRYWSELTQQQLAEACGCSLPTVCQALHQAWRRFRKLWLEINGRESI